MADTNLRIMVLVEGTSEAAGQLKGVSGAIDQTGTASEEASSKSSKFGGQLKALATGFAVYKGFQFMKSAVSTTTDLAKATATLQRVTGMDTQTAAGWAATAEERGISTKTLSTGMATLGRNLDGVSKSSKTSIAAFAQLGISQKQLKGANTQQVLGMVSDGLAKLPPGAQKAAAAQKLLGRSGTQLLPILNNGSKALNEQIDTMGKQTGITDKNLKSGLALAKQQREMSAAMLGVKVAIGTALIPILTGLTQALLPVMQTFAKLMQQSPAFRTAIYALAAGLTALKLAMFFGGGLATGGWIGLIVALGVALVTAYNKVKWFHDAVNAVWNAIKNTAVAAFNFIKAHWQLVVLALLGPIAFVAAEIITHWTAIKNAAASAFNSAKGTIVGVFNAIKNTASSVFNAIKGTVGSIADGISKAWTSAFGAIKSSIQGVIDIINSLVSTAQKIANLPGKVGGLISKGISGGEGLVSKVLAGGGTIAPGGEIALVGERGPEIVALPGGSTVIPNHQIHGYAGGAGRIEIPVYLDRRQIALAMGDYTADKQAAR